MAQDRITLTVPARGEYARTVRMTAAALVSRMGMTYDEVDDVRMAAEEAFVYAVDTLPEDAEVTFTFTLDEDALEIERAARRASRRLRRGGRAASRVRDVHPRVGVRQYEFASDEDGAASAPAQARSEAADAD